MAGETGGAAAAGTWTLGDLRVNRIGFGAMRLPQRGPAFAPGAIPGDRDQAIAVLRAAVELGVNHIDTAGFYFSSLRSANELINTALAPYPDDLVIATKVGPRRDPAGQWLDQATPAQLRGQVEENLRQLGRDYLDLVNLRLSGLDSIAGHFGALAELRDVGLIRHLGVSNARPEHLAQARQIAPVVCVQNSYGLGHHPGRTSSCAPAASRAWRSSRSSPSPEAGARLVLVAQNPSRSSRSPASTRPPRRRSAWHGPCTADRTCWSSQAHPTPPTSPTTSRPESYASSPVT